MTTVNFTDFRRRASGVLSAVERGEVFVIVRHGRPIAELGPLSTAEGQAPAWKRPGLRLAVAGGSLTRVILAERARG
jgi:prevent-host-death family protein